MKFKLTTEYRYPWDVTVRKPDPENAGETVEQKFTMIFRQLSDEEAEKIDERGNEITAMEAGAERDRLIRRHQHELLRRVCVDWDHDVVDDNGKALPFSVETFEVALGDVYFRAGVYKAYADSVRLDGGRLGN